MPDPPRSAKARRVDITNGTIGRTLFRLAWPMFMGMLSMTVFNLTDTYFVARLGTEELAAMSFTFPVVMLVSSLTLGLGLGLTSSIAPKIGAGDREAVRRLARDGLIFAVLVVAVVSSVGVLSIDPLFSAMGADEATRALIGEYMMIWFAGAVFVVVPMVGNSAIRGTGDTMTPAVTMSIAAALNMTLDPLLIFGIGPFPALGLQGAALATVIGRATTLVVALYVLIHRERLVKAAVPKMHELMENWKEMLSVGVPAALANVMGPLSMGMITGIVATHGAAAVAGFGAASRVEMFAYMIPAALGSGIVPFVGQNWGAGHFDRVRGAIRIAERFLVTEGFLLWVIIALLAEPIAGIFTEDPAVNDSLVLFLRVGMATFFFDAVTATAISILNGLQQGMRAMALNALRLLAFLVPFTFTGSWLFGLAGAFGGFALARTVAGGIAHLWLKQAGNRLKPKTHR